MYFYFEGKGRETISDRGAPQNARLSSLYSQALFDLFQFMAGAMTSRAVRYFSSGQERPSANIRSAYLSTRLQPAASTKRGISAGASFSGKSGRALFQKGGNAFGEIVRAIDGLNRRARDGGPLRRALRQNLADEVFQHRQHERGIGGNLDRQFARSRNCRPVGTTRLTSPIS